MMVLSALRPEASLAEFLAHRARSASVRRLSMDIVAGVLGLGAVWLWRPHGWLVLASIAACFSTYGAWGLADRARQDPPNPGSRLLHTSMNALCAVMAVAGVIAAATLLLSVWAIALGTWIS